MPDSVLDGDGLPLFDTRYRWGVRKDGDNPLEGLDTIGPGLLDCARTAIERVYKQWAQDPNWTQLMGVLSDVFQPIEDAIGSVAWQRYVRTATGVQLDEVGALINRPRGALVDDDVYRAIIIVDAITTITESTVPDLIDMLRRVVDRRVQIFEQYPASFNVVVADIPTILFGPLVDAISDFPSAGVGSTIETFDSLTFGVVSSSFADEIPLGTFVHSTSSLYLEPFTTFAAEI